MDKKFYQDLLDNVSDGVYFVNLDRNITYWNGGALGRSADGTVESRQIQPNPLVMRVIPKDRLASHWGLVVCREGDSADICVGCVLDPFSWPVG